MRYAKAFICAVLLVSALAVTSCADAYAPIESTENELRVVARVGDNEVFYDELRFLAVTTKNAITASKGVNWDDPVEAEEYRDELETMVWGNLLYNYGIYGMFDEAYGNYGSVDEALADEIKSIVDELGGREKYIEYLEGNALTDRLLRFNIKADLCELELISYYSQITGEIDTSYARLGEFLYSEDSGAELIRVLHICVSGETEGAYDLLLDLRGRIVQGADAFALAEQYGKDYSEIGENGDYITRGEYHTDYETAAFSLVVGELSDILCIESDYYLIYRLEKDMNYINDNYDALYQKYLYTEFDKIADAYISKLGLEKTELGKSLDLVAIK